MDSRLRGNDVLQFSLILKSLSPKFSVGDSPYFQKQTTTMCEIRFLLLLPTVTAFGYQSLGEVFKYIGLKKQILLYKDLRLLPYQLHLSSLIYLQSLIERFPVLYLY